MENGVDDKSPVSSLFSVDDLISLSSETRITMVAFPEAFINHQKKQQWRMTFRHFIYYDVIAQSYLMGQ